MSNILTTCQNAAMLDWPVPPEVLRFEVDAMLGALVKTVQGHLPPHRMRGLYFKGSASKPWQAPLDYVPEISDLDLHLWLRDPVDAEWLSNSRAALDFSAEVEARYLTACPNPIHWPRPQVQIINEMCEEPGWARSPVHLLHGEPYPGGTPDPVSDRQNIIRHAREAAQLGLHHFDKQGPDLWATLRALNWRVSPAASRVLSALGAGEDEAWGSPRSVLVGRLRDHGLAPLADLLTRYYAACWSAFDARWRDPRPLRLAISAALDALAMAERVI